MRTATVILDELADRFLKTPAIVYYILGTDKTWRPIPESTFNYYIERIHTFTEQMNLKLQTHNAAFIFSNRVHRS